MVPSDRVLGLDEVSESGFAKIFRHLEVGIKERASNTLKEDQSEVGLCVSDSKGFGEFVEELGTPSGAVWASYDMPRGFDGLVAGWASVCFGFSDAEHVFASWK